MIRIKISNRTSHKVVKRTKNKARIRKRVEGSTERPRLTVYKSARHFYAQIVDDTTGRTLVSASTLGDEINGVKKTDAAKLVGKKVAEKALAQNIKTVVFDRSGYVFHGRVKAVADGAREAGLIF